MNTQGKMINLRAIERKDLPLLKAWSNDIDLQYWLGGWHFPSSDLIMEKWLDRLQTDELDQRFAVTAQEYGLIGTANLVNINWKDRNACSGLMIGNRDLQSLGYGTDTLMTIMRLAFEELNLERLDTTIIEYNHASYHLHTEKCGWQEEGRKKNYYWRKNRFWEQIIIGIHRTAYFSFMEKNPYWSE